MPQPRTLRDRWVIPLTLGCLLGFYLFTIREGHVWDDDAGMYIVHARNIASGHSYSDTGYIFNPDYPQFSPRIYPPGFPLLLAPIWALRGLDLNAMKALESLLLVASLGFFSLLYSRRLKPQWLNPWVSAALIAVTGMSPVIWNHKDFIGSDFPFLFFLFLAAAAIHRWNDENGPSYKQASVIAVVIFAAFATRSVGILLLPAMLAVEWLRTRRLSRPSIFCIAVALALCGGQVWMTSLGAEPSLIRISPALALRHIHAYAFDLTYFWGQEVPRLSLALAILTALLACAGIVLRLRSKSGFSAIEIFSLLYLALLLVYPPLEIRYLFPLWPALLALAAEALQAIAAALPATGRFAAVGLLLLAMGAAYAGRYRAIGFGPIEPSITDSDFRAVTEYLRSHTSPSDTILFRKARFLPLLAGRTALTYALQPDLGPFVHRVRPRFAVVSQHPQGIFASDALFLTPYLTAHPSAARLVFQDSNWRVFQMLNWP